MSAPKTNSANLLLPSFEEGYWRSTERIPYKKHPEFSRKKKHFEPESHSSFASRWAAELTREEHSAEIRQIYENAVLILGNKRSQMERAERSVGCEQFRFTLGVDQDPANPTVILVSRALTVKVPLNALAPHFDEIFPYRPTELVVPVTGQPGHRQILEIFEDWEVKWRGKITESPDQRLITLHVNGGFAMAVDLNANETIFSKQNTEGVSALASSIAGDLRRLGIAKALL